MPRPTPTCAPNVLSMQEPEELLAVFQLLGRPSVTITHTRAMVAAASGGKEKLTFADFVQLFMQAGIWLRVPFGGWGC